MGQMLHEEWEVLGGWPGGFAPTVILKSPRALTNEALCCAEEPGWVVARDSPPFLRKEKHDCSIVIDMHSCVGMNHPQMHLQRDLSPDSEDSIWDRHQGTGNDCNQENMDGVAS